MSPNDDDPEEVKKGKERFMWFGFGGYPGWVDASAFHPINVSGDVGLFDKLLELFGVKEKPEEEVSENEQ